MDIGVSTSPDLRHSIGCIQHVPCLYCICVDHLGRGGGTLQVALQLPLLRSVRVGTRKVQVWMAFDGAIGPTREEVRGDIPSDILRLVPASTVSGRDEKASGSSTRSLPSIPCHLRTHLSIRQPHAGQLPSTGWSASGATRSIRRFLELKCLSIRASTASKSSGS
eukprot:679914-Hanusia_phi.AAC.5